MDTLLQMQNEKAIHVSVWDDLARQKVVNFWQERGITFTETSNDFLRGRRGSIWGNLTSYNMSKLLAKLTIERIAPDRISCLLDVNTLYQDVTEWNKAYWQLEMDTFESYLICGDQRKAEWQQFLVDSKTAAWQWSLSFAWFGRKMPPKP